HIDYLDLFKDIQQKGKAVRIWGSFEQLQVMHRELDPTKVIYNTGASSLDEAMKILNWFKKNT
ncbi:MAG TPA: hypothetical protein DCY35_10220, partial [Prolixibacteraceae bacterium]|nr:hypothetical protein [Prolixibacteraceae bacterium]